MLNLENLDFNPKGEKPMGEKGGKNSKPFSPFFPGKYPRFFPRVNTLLANPGQGP